MLWSGFGDLLEANRSRHSGLNRDRFHGCSFRIDGEGVEALVGVPAQVPLDLVTASES